MTQPPTRCKRTCLEICGWALCTSHLWSGGERKEVPTGSRQYSNGAQAAARSKIVRSPGVVFFKIVGNTSGLRCNKFVCTMVETDLIPIQTGVSWRETPVGP